MISRGARIAALALVVLSAPISADAKRLPADYGDTLAGIARTVDGDTLDLRTSVGHVRIRLHGIDAPEGKQLCRNAAAHPYRCGDQATAHMRQMVEGHALACTVQDHDRYKRTVAVCYLGGLDIGREMVRNGHAIAFVRYSRLYVADEIDARAARRGLWAGAFQMPAEWRRDHPR